MSLRNVYRSIDREFSQFGNTHSDNFVFVFLPTLKVGGAVYTPVFTVVYEWKCLVKYLSNLSFHLSFVHFANTCFTLFLFSILFCLLVQRTEMHEQTACIPKVYCMQKYAPD